LPFSFIHSSFRPCTIPWTFSRVANERSPSI
jgi:hypothetical protein